MNRRIIPAFFTLSLLAGMGYGQPVGGRPQSIAAMAKINSRARRIEHGQQGAAQRKAAGEFSGTPEWGITEDDARRGSPEETAAQPRTEENDAVEVTGTRFTRLTEVNDQPAPTRRGAFTGGDEGADFTYDPRSRLISPVNGAVLDPVTTFQWSTGTGVTDHWLWVGSCQDCVDLLSEEQGRQTARTIPLPVDGRRIYVTLFSYVGGAWYFVDYQFTASRDTARMASMITPTPGTTLGTTHQFTWDPGRYVDQMWLRIGTCSGCADIFDENQGLHTYRVVNFASRDRVVYVRLYSRINGAWYYYEYQYREPGTLRAVRANVTNKLAWPINVLINGKVMGSVPAYETRYVDANVSSLTLSFELVRPALSGRALGDAMSGVFNEIPNASGTYNFTVNNKIGSDYFFAPLITNRTASAVLIEVNGGLQSQNRCNCTAGANSTRVGTGYYRFFLNSNVRLYRSGSNYTGSYRYWGSAQNPIKAEVDSGVVEFTLTVAP